MRRIASLFRSKHPDASPPPQTLLIPSSPSTPLLTPSSNPSHSSASSTASASVRTPDDDPNTRSHSKKSWLPTWLSNKRSGSLKPSPDFDDRPSPPDVVLHRNVPAPIPPLAHTHDIDDDDSSQESDDDNDDENDTDIRIIPPVLPSPRLQLEKSRNHLQVLIANSLSSPPPSPPLYHIPGTHPFPRSCNLSRLLPPPNPLRVSMLKTRLLHVLQHTPTLSATDARLLASLGTRPAPVPVQRAPVTTEDVVVDPSRLSRVSPGVSRWLSRSCFEDRFTVWLPSSDSTALTSHPVSSRFAVAELEFSEVIETLAVDFAQSPPLTQDEFNPLTLPMTQEEHSDRSSASSSSSSLSGEIDAHGCQKILTPELVPCSQRNAPYKATPSPLRIQYGPSSSQTSPVSPTSDSQTQISTAIPPEEPETQPVPAKRGVRFAEDGKEDQIPLAYVLRIKKQREEKARFLREQRERRAFEEERRKQELERMERERERREWERERKAWEAERKAMEEERKAKLYAEEIAAARRRRESARAGAYPASPISTSPPSPPSREPDDRRRRDSRGYLRPPYDSQQRRQGSDSSMAVLDHGVRSGSSRPPSVGHGGASPSGSGSRPASIYSAHTMSSSEDGRLRDAANGSIRSKKRGSIGSLSSQRPPSEHRSPSYSSVHDLVPPVPPVPQPYAMDVPLLPPTPPFMMHQFPRPRSANSASSGSSRHQLPRSGSADRMDAPPPTQNNNLPVSPHREKGSNRRRASGENVTSSLPDRGPYSRPQPSSYSRGSQVPVQLGMFPMSPGPNYYLQSPWTALPTMAQLQQQGAMVMSFNGRPPLGRPAAIS